MITVLDSATLNNTKEFIPMFTNAKVIKVCDGNMIIVAAIIYDVVYRFSIKLYGISVPDGCDTFERERKGDIYKK